MSGDEIGYAHRVSHLVTISAAGRIPPKGGTFGAKNRRKENMVTVALLVHLEAKPGKEADLAAFLKAGLPIVREEPKTIAWFVNRLGQRTFSIFDAFPDEQGRQDHLAGRLAVALMAKAGELLARPPVIEKVDVLAAKLPESG